jgi:hypothetical protein
MVRLYSSSKSITQHMKLYCNIEKVTSEDGTTVWAIKQGPCELPQNDSNVSNLNLLDDKTLKLFGWVPVEQITENKPIFVSVSYNITEDKVIETTITRDKTEEEINADKEKENYYAWQRLREERNHLLSQSDKLVLIDRWEGLTDTEKQKIVKYRQSLRDLPTQNSDPNLITFPVL